MKKVVFVLFVIQILEIAFVAFSQTHLPPVIPLMYGQPGGADQLAPRQYLFALPAVSFAVFIVCFLWTKFSKDEFLTPILLGLSFVTSLLSILAIYKITMLVGNF